MYSVWIPNHATSPTAMIRVTKHDGGTIAYKHLGRAKTLAQNMVSRIKHPFAEVRDENGSMAAVVGILPNSLPTSLFQRTGEEAKATAIGKDSTQTSVNGNWRVITSYNRFGMITSRRGSHLKLDLSFTGSASEGYTISAVNEGDNACVVGCCATFADVIESA